MDLFEWQPPASYPDRPGYKGRATSFAAAEAISERAPKLRDRVLAAIRKEPGTPEEVAARLDEPVMNIRPRCSELAAKSLIADSGHRRKAMGGRNAIVWQAVPQ